MKKAAVACLTGKTTKISLLVFTYSACYRVVFVDQKLFKHLFVVVYFKLRFTMVTLNLLKKWPNQGTCFQTGR